MRLISASNAQYSDAANTHILMTAIIETVPAVPETPATDEAPAIPAVPAVVETMPFQASSGEPGLAGEAFTRAAAGEFGTIAAYVAPPPTIPASVSLWQAKAILQQTTVPNGSGNLLDAANAHMAASNNIVLQSFWRDAATLDRASPTLASLAAHFGLTDAQIDAMFIAAAALKL